MSAPGPPPQGFLEQSGTLLYTAASWMRLPAIASTVRHTASLPSFAVLPMSYTFCLLPSAALHVVRPALAPASASLPSECAGP